MKKQIRMPSRAIFLPFGKYSLSLAPDINGHGYGGEKDKVSDRDTDV